MPRPLLAAFVGAFLAFAQQHEIPQLNSCIREFYDPEMYNYLTFKNICAQTLTVVLVAKDGSSAGGTMELRPGGKDSVGKSQGKDPKPGSFELYICPTGNVPIDDQTNQPVSKPGAKFHCQQKT